MDELSAARALLPTWVRVAPWVVGPVLGLVGYLLARWVLVLPALPEEPWWERARLVHPVRRAGFLIRVVMLTVAGLFVVTSLSSWVSPGTAVRAPLTLALAWAGPLFASLQFEGRLRGLPLSVLGRSLATQVVVVFGPVYLLLGLMAVSNEGTAGIAIGVAGTLVALWLSSGGGLGVAKRLGLARSAPERASLAVERASKRLGVSFREVLELDWAVANAMAFPLARKIAFTRGALDALDDSELELVAAHELGHVNEPLAMRLYRPLVLGTVTGVGLFLPRFGASLASLVAILLGVLAVLIGTRLLVRRAEGHADAHAKDSEGAYAHALEKLYRLNLMPAVLRRGGTHGHLYDRLVAAGQPPSWPRPAPPSQPGLSARVAAVAVVLVAAVALALLSQSVRTRDEALRALALGDGSGWTVEVLARTAANETRLEDAVTLYRVAHRLTPGAPFIGSALVVSLANVARCEEAQAELQEVEAVAAQQRLRADAREALGIARGAAQRCVQR